ncbi:MAG: pyridoxal-phosphate dependent enzyme [Chloroflexia bacterium]|nr:pyridoxal-phosphate dependent enzyme [Chloroflexia bacterium]
MTNARHDTQRPVRPPADDDLDQARRVIGQHLQPTPLMESRVAGASCFLKLESMQPTGSFKVRGALAAAAAVPEGHRILAVSAGNHALGIAWASQRLGIPATVVIAETASPAKRAKLEALPIELIRYGQSYDEAEAYAIELARDAGDGTVFISAYNDPLVIAGASTVLDEIVDQRSGSGPLTVVVPASGGGLLAGIALRASHLRSDEAPITVIGVEVANSPAMSAALRTGYAVEVPVGDTIADGLSGNIEPGSVTIDVICGRVEGIVAVTESELHGALRFLATEHGLVAEGAGAASLAALLAGKVQARNGEVVAIVSGRNIALPKLASVYAESGGNA